MSKYYPKYLFKSDEFSKVMVSTLGEVDFELIENFSVESLYYLFPLLERTVLEYLKFQPDADIEHYLQGTFRTLTELLKKNEEVLEKVLSVKDIKELYKIYSDSDTDICPRNKLLHYNQNATGDLINSVIHREALEIFYKLIVAIRLEISLGDKNKLKKISKIP